MNGAPILLILTLFPIIGSICSYIIGRYSKKARNIMADVITGIEVCLILGLFVFVSTTGKDLEFRWEGFCFNGLHLKLDGFRVLYALVASFMWLMTTVFSEQYFHHYRNRNRYYLFMLMTLGATVGVFVSADLFTTFIFFEIMSFTSYVWVIHDETPESMKAAQTYLAVAVIGGMVMLMGLFLLYDGVGTLEISRLLSAVRASDISSSRLYLTGALIVFGFGAKAGMFPLHIWLPKAHPVAPAPASALLSGMLTKCGVFGILAVTSNIFLHDHTWGMAIEYLGVITMFLGALLAVFSINLKRTLACSSMSQIGFILVGVGMQCLLGEENALAVRGTLLHMVNHSLIKLDLFMVAGAVYMNLHKLDLNEIRGFGKNKPLLKLCFLSGALGIGGIPLFNGYVSKTLLHEAIVEYTQHLHHMGGNAALFKTIEWIFLVSGGMTVAYMTKLFVCLFVERNNDERKQQDFDSRKSYWTIPSAAVITISAGVLPVLGMFPYLTMDALADLGQTFMHGESPAHRVHYFALTNLKGACVSIAIGAFIYFFIIRKFLMKETENGNVYADLWPQWLDLENLIYRPVIEKLLPEICGYVCAVLDRYIIQIPLMIFMAVSGWLCMAADRAEAVVKPLIGLGTFFARLSESLTDWVILAFGKTTHRQLKLSPAPVSDHRLAHKAGNLMDRMAERYGRSDKTSHVPGLVMKQERFRRTTDLIRKSFTFGLLMASIGLMVVLVYVLIRA